MAKLVCPFGHQEVTVDGDGHDYTGHCDVCGRPLKVAFDSQADVPKGEPKPVATVGPEASA